MRRILLLPKLLLRGLPAGALAARENPAGELIHLPIEASVYDEATHRSSKSRPGVKHVNTTVAHRDRIHIGMTRAGAGAKTSFWRRHTG